MLQLNIMESEQFMNRFNEALNMPIHSRCAELTVLFDRGNTKDLQVYFPILIDHIFGPQTGVSWELRSTTMNTNAQNFKALQYFLSLTGPIFRLITTLLKEPHVKYEYSLSFIPLKIQQLLESQCAHPFYTELVNINQQTKQIVSLLLNPFDYYIFHFAYHLINPWHQRSTSITTWNTVYYMLCCDYVLHFLPTDPKYVVTPVINFYTGKNPVHTFQTIAKPARTTKLLRNAIFQEQLNEFSTSIHQPLEKHPRNETWRSETVLTVFIDMWLGNDQLNNRFDNFNMSQSQSLHFNELPTGEYIRIIRVLVKQIHAFSSSAKIDDTYMVELKKIALPMLQGKIYVFLRNLVHRWPLDGSFRLVLELWLSFIQPWRYPGNVHLKERNQQDVNQDIDDVNTVPQKSVDREYLPFIAENLLSYIVIFQQLLPRFSRVDLASPKNSLMLYRLTKVFDQPNLVQLLREIESTVENKNQSPTHSFNTSWPPNMPPLSPTTNWSSNTYFTSTPPKNGINSSSFMMNSSNVRLTGKYTAIIRQKIQDLEGHNFCYKSLFTVPAAPEVHELIRQIKKAEKVAQDIIQARLDEINCLSSGFSGFFKTLFSTIESSNDEFTLEERKKVPIYLNLSFQQLCNMFEITNAEILEPIIERNVTNNALNNDNLQLFLTPEKVRQRIKSIKYEGDPDLHPIRSNENEFLVRTLYQLSTKINEKFRPTIYKLYIENNLMSKIAKQILHPPIVVYKYDKTQPGRSPKIPIQLPPRLSLRYFGSYKFLSYLTIGLIVSNLIGYPTIVFVFFVLFVYLIYIFLKAVYQNSSRTDQDVQNFSFNESF